MFTGVNHDPEAMKVIQDKAVETKCPLYIVKPLDSHTMPEGLIERHHQRENAALAIELAEMFLQITKCETPATRKWQWFDGTRGRDIKSLSRIR